MLTEKYVATVARVCVTITAIVATTVVTVIKPDVAPVFTSVAVGAISGFFAISRNNDNNKSE